jgi:hypothetical protein
MEPPGCSQHGDLDGWLEYFSAERLHSGKHCHGNTPPKTFEAARALAQKKQTDALNRTP